MVKRPHDGTRALKIVILLSLGLRHDPVRELLKCEKKSVGETERWFRTVSFRTADALGNDEAVKKSVEQILVAEGKSGQIFLEEHQLSTAKELKWEGVLRHLRPGETKESVSIEDSTREKATPNKIVVDAKQDHFKDLLVVTNDWKHDLVTETGDLIFLDDQLLPFQFSAEDAEARWHEKGSLVWLVGNDGEVTAWMAVERRKRRLFTALIKHLPSLAMKHQELMDKIGSAIKAVVATPAVTQYVQEIPNMASGLANELEITLENRVFPGSCHICDQIESSVDLRTTN